MKFFVVYLLFYFLFLLSLAGQQKDDIHINGSFKNLPFNDFVNKLENQYPIHFCFDENWVKSLIINIEVYDLSVPQLMDKVLLPTLLDYVYQSPGTIFILPDRKFVRQLPEWRINIFAEGNLTELKQL